MYCILNFYAICFLKFIVHTMNYEMVKSEMVKLAGERRLMWLWIGCYRLVQLVAGALLIERKKANMLRSREKESVAYH
jgi:hypothetical protein